MKVLFLDIDGVLNSVRYDRERDMSKLSNIDETRLPILQHIVKETSAVIILTSSWRTHWDADMGKRDAEGAYIEDVFTKYGLKIGGKTEELGRTAQRREEIEAWLASHETEAFAILDDSPFGWGRLSPFLVRTDARIGRGLEMQHAERAIALLRSSSPQS